MEAFQRALKDVLRCVDFIQEGVVSHGSTWTKKLCERMY